jgi:hydrogenase expression/formation protein HypC
MCLAVPGQVTEIRRENEVLMGEVDFSGIRKEVCLDLTPGVVIGEYVLVHVGFALAKVDATQAARIFEALAELQQGDGLEVPGT